jgi:16S rRNA (adenine1518-N6/adenine1519-N6)-dimethyltransferase
MYAKKSLGQNFLHSERALFSIRDGADPTGDDIILEIGPGKGALTDKLIPLAGKIVAVEKDDELYELLKGKYKKEIEKGTLDLIHGDILDFDPNIFSFYKDLTYKIVANIPYNITGLIFRKFLSADTLPERIVILVQKEVAERIVAKDKKESILSISVKVYGTPIYIERVLAGSFSPAPNVDSAILLIQDISKDFFKNFSEKDFFLLLKAGFAAKRKKLSSNLGNIIDKKRVEEAFQILSLDANTRAEDVPVQIWGELGQILLNPRA